MSTFKFKLYQQLEHKIKHLGTVMSSVYALFLGAFLLFLDFQINYNNHFFTHSLEIYSRLIPVSNVLVSIIIGISLTTFSVIFVVMQLASSQFSPRILRHFLANDFKIQAFIGLFVGTIALCVLPQIMSVFYPNQSFLITLFVGTFLAIRGLVWSYPSMITYLSVNMNVSSITHHIKKEVVDEITILYSQKWEKGNDLTYERQQCLNNRNVLKIVSPFQSGYLESVDYALLQKGLLELKETNQWEEVYQKPVIGEFIMKDTTVLLQIVVDQVSEKQKETFQNLVSKTFKVNRFRSHTQDINFGVRKLVDIGIKAISPAVNDPTTCLNCIDQLGEIVKVLSERQFPSTDARQLIKSDIHINEFNYDEFIDFCFDQIYQWGKEDPIIVKRILRTIRSILPTIQNPYHLKVLIQQVEEMELATIYNLDNYQNRYLKISKEKLNTIEKELQGFREKALKQIENLKKLGFFEAYLVERQLDEKGLSESTIQTLNYLNTYLK
ncbi:hypothetical protein AX766_00700 [Flavobacterium covae]|uniref:DUF2254 family protein n=1 Tax=Flavobacterium covae TaxID=2906076 RepID=A0ABW8PID5_9FLAO|nr:MULTISPECIES: DUF2254 family protein [Flavobacterium]OXA82696.1 hypothetical protein B0A56_04485 [Flavobacterium columnare NBRC 100251 = ATCC 23463]AND63042.1 hypothetical protein AX766_00700 [Flavobacterium covae]MCJ1806845.1 DUF2254 domain-containing protein [Flavobacterium covae]OWP81248.1 hypothetical protein BWK63_06890 [Flavobacterium covae]POR21504.1 hypothetical protein BWK57_09825 [Flavobacterium columnare]